MRPSSVCMPVANTTARASPPVALVPLKRRSRAAIRGTPRVDQLGRAQRRGRLAGERREVHLDGARRSGACRRRCGRPPRRPRRRRGPARRRRSRRASRRAAPSPAGAGTARAPRRRARPASPARTRSTALSAITSRTATATVSLPTANDSAAASHSSSASGCVSWRASSRGHFRPPRRRSSLGPYCISRRSASRVESPVRELRKSRSSNSTLSVMSMSTASCAVGPSALSGRRSTGPCPCRLNRPSSCARARARGSAGTE